MTDVGNQASAECFASGQRPGRGTLVFGAGGASVGAGLGAVATENGGLRSTSIDCNVQEYSRRFFWSGSGQASVSVARAAPIDLSRETNGALARELGTTARKLVTCE